jgi:CubicO group peptidase (beta-lactamase class C family)
MNRPPCGRSTSRSSACQTRISVAVILTLVGFAEALAAADLEPSLRARGHALERMVESRNPQALDDFIAEHVAVPPGDAGARAALRQKLETIRERCGDAGGVVWEPNGERGLRVIFHTDQRRQPVEFEVDPEPPHRIVHIVQGDASVIPAVTVAPMTWETLERRLVEEERNGFSGVVLAARDGKIVLHRGFGHADRERNVINTTNSLFAIGSTPIDFTRAAVLKLMDQGLLKLTDPIARFLPTVPPDKQRITLEHLMTGRSGLKDFHGIPGVDEDLDLSWIDRATALQRILGSELLFEPGSDRAHSHSAWGLLAAVIEIVSDESYESFLRRHFFEPLGMTRTGTYPLTRKFNQDEIAVGYGPVRIPPVNSPAHWGRTSWLVMGSGGMVSTPADLFRWNQGVCGGKVLSPESTRRYGRGAIAAGGNERGFFTLYNVEPETMVIVCTNGHESPRDHAAMVADAAVRVTRQP